MHSDLVERLDVKTLLVFGELVVFVEFIQLYKFIRCYYFSFLIHIFTLILRIFEEKLSLIDKVDEL